MTKIALIILLFMALATPCALCAMDIALADTVSSERNIVASYDDRRVTHVDSIKRNLKAIYVDAATWRHRKFKEQCKKNFRAYEKDRLLLQDTTYKGDFPLKKYYHIAKEANRNGRTHIVYDCVEGDNCLNYDGVFWSDGFLKCTLVSWDHLKGGQKQRNIHELYLPTKPQAVFLINSGFFLLYEDDQVVWVTSKLLDCSRDKEYYAIIENLKIPEADRWTEISDEFVTLSLAGTPLYLLNGRYDALLQFYGDATELPQLIPGRMNMYYSEGGVCIIAYNVTPEFKTYLEHPKDSDKDVFIF